MAEFRTYVFTNVLPAACDAFAAKWMIAEHKGVEVNRLGYTTATRTLTLTIGGDDLSKYALPAFFATDLAAPASSTTSNSSTLVKLRSGG